MLLAVVASSTYHLKKVKTNNTTTRTRYWQLPKPPKTHNKEWHKIVRLTKKIPFGYEVDPDNDRLLVPVEHELEALELAKRHLKQYSYRAVAQWLSKETDRYISHMGLKKRDRS